MGTFLSGEEVASLTGKIQRSAQVRALRSMGIEHRQRPDGSVVVLRSHLEKVLGGSTRTHNRNPQPKWDAI